MSLNFSLPQKGSGFHKFSCALKSYSTSCTGSQIKCPPSVQYLAHHRPGNGSFLSTREFKTLQLTLYAEPFQHLHIGYLAKNNTYAAGEGAEWERHYRFKDYRQIH